MKPLQCVKGMHDILPDEVALWHHLEEKFRALLAQYDYAEIRTPMLEPQALFLRAIGAATDIVEKEMYAFVDKGGDALALRPEGTASVVRAYLQHTLGATMPISRLYYIGPMFRRERPAKGRYRQFFQAGAELIGAAEPAADAEIIDMAVQYIRGLGLSNVRVQLNSLGDAQTRPLFRDALVAYFSQRTERLCADCRRRLETNPLRILDCKVPTCQAEAQGAPVILDYLNPDDAAHFAEVQRLLTLFGIPFDVVPTMVRGLDYYTQTIFEIQGSPDALGAQATIVGGGRYNDLIAQMGGRATPTIGFALGMERLLILVKDLVALSPPPLVFVAGAGEGGLDRAMLLSRTLRAAGLRVLVPFKEGSLRAQLKRANKSGATLAVIAGSEEAQRDAVTLRHLETGEQTEVPVAELVATIEAQQ
ncbi:MAG: histidine--tRNA ligase [Proteobacteria bacterium]|nr:histidine--tRNA ligase [Pseudomonadota bacterium]